MEQWLENLCKNCISKIENDSELCGLFEPRYKIPNIYKGTGKIKLIILGQDPTVRNSIKRANVTTVLNLDKRGSLRCYILEICNKLGITFDRNIYATNLLKNFFIEPPTTLEKINKKPIILKYSKYWIEVLKKEIKLYPNIPILIFGEPLLKVLVNKNQSYLVRDYWGYSPQWKNNVFKSCSYIRASDNKLNRIIIPFPHQPSSTKEFYKKQFNNYCCFINQQKLIK